MVLEHKQQLIRLVHHLILIFMKFMMVVLGQKVLTSIQVELHLKEQEQQLQEEVHHSVPPALEGVAAGIAESGRDASLRSPGLR